MAAALPSARAFAVRKHEAGDGEGDAADDGRRHRLAEHEG